jgi:hypothetical protein
MVASFQRNSPDSIAVKFVVQVGIDMPIAIASLDGRARVRSEGIVIS